MNESNRLLETRKKLVEIKIREINSTSYSPNKTFCHILFVAHSHGGVEHSHGVGADHDHNSIYPHKIGTISRLTYHPLSGDLWAIDDQTLEFKDFTYDGEGPDAFFIAGLQTASAEPNPYDAVVVPYAGPGQDIARSAYK